MEKKSIGILGGMGPLATADLFQKIVLHTAATCDNGHIRIYMDNNPSIPDRTTAILHGGDTPLPRMLESAKKLEVCGADYIMMPCNTAHYFLPQLEEGVSVPFISILEETVKAGSMKFPGKTAGVLCTTGTYLTKLYDNTLTKHNVSFRNPSDEGKELLMEAIFAIKGGKSVLYLKDKIISMLNGMKDAGVDYFIFGCTELPILAQELEIDVPFVDSTLELAKSAIRYAGYEVK